MTDRVLWKSGDDLSESNLGESLNRSNATNYVERGLDVTVNWSDEEFHVTEGLAFRSYQMRNVALLPEEHTSVPLEVRAEDGVDDTYEPTENTTYLYLEFDPSEQNALEYVVSIHDDLGGPRLLIADLDGPGETVTPRNQEPTGRFRELASESAPTDSEDVARKAETDAIASDVDSVETAQSTHENVTEAHGADGNVQGANDVSGAISTHSNNADSHHAKDHETRHHKGGDDELEVVDLDASTGSEDEVPTVQADGSLAYSGVGGRTDEEIASAAQSHKSIDNPTVSIQLDPGESTTVPSGEVWRVSIAATGREGASGTYIEINGANVGGHDSNTRIGFESVVLTGGDTVSCPSGSDESLHIGGFVVNDSNSIIYINETPVSEQLSPGDSITVPSGEVWQVGIATSGRNDSDGVNLEINGSRVFGYDGDALHGTEQTVVVGGDTIEAHSGGERAVHINGFVVND